LVHAVVVARKDSIALQAEQEIPSTSSAFGASEISYQKGKRLKIEEKEQIDVRSTSPVKSLPTETNV
jgi:hypothetical protein